MCVWYVQVIDHFSPPRSPCANGEGILQPFSPLLCITHPCFDVGFLGLLPMFTIVCHFFLDKHFFGATSLRQGVVWGFEPLPTLSSPGVGSHQGFKALIASDGEI
jgi:hypothetical protein